MKNKIPYWVFERRLLDAAYTKTIKEQAKELKSDGCTGVSELYRPACLEHDIAYRTGKDPYGFPVSRREADKRFRWHMQFLSPAGTFSPVAWGRWIGVRIGASKAYKGSE